MIFLPKAFYFKHLINKSLLAKG